MRKTYRPVDKKMDQLYYRKLANHLVENSQLRTELISSKTESPIEYNVYANNTKCAIRLTSETVTVHGENSDDIRRTVSALEGSGILLKEVEF